MYPREAAQETRYIAYRRGLMIDADNAKQNGGRAPRVEGPKEQVLRIYVQGNINEAIAEAQKLGYNEEICKAWITEFEFKTKIQKTYIKDGEDAAQKLFKKTNQDQFDGKFRIETFRNWINAIAKDNEYR